MPDLNEHQSAKSNKILIVGDSGTGKTGGLASLANAGYKLRILDFDNGLTPLKKYAKPPFDVKFETLSDEYTQINGVLRPKGVPKAFSRAMSLLDAWPGDGPVSSWDESYVLVIDSMTYMGRAALLYVAAIQNRTLVALTERASKGMREGDWGDAIAMTEDVFALIKSPTIRCNVIVTSHLTFDLGSDGTVMKAWPSALGSKLPRRVASYFDIVLTTKKIGGARMLSARDAILDTKIPVDLPDLPVATGLAEVFKRLQA